VGPPVVGEAVASESAAVGELSVAGAVGVAVLPEADVVGVEVMTIAVGAVVSSLSKSQAAASGVKNAKRHSTHARNGFIVYP
jgi:hypothetical protein